MSCLPARCTAETGWTDPFLCPAAVFSGTFPRTQLPTFLTRRVTFAAAHRYRIPDWSDEENERVFGTCARLNYHGHSYVCEVTVNGDVDPRTGFAADLPLLDDILRREVRERFDHRNINLDVPEFADGALVPTGENLSRFIFERVQTALAGRARVVRVTVAEDDTLRVTFEGE